MLVDSKYVDKNKMTVACAMHYRNDPLSEVFTQNHDNTQEWIELLFDMCVKSKCSISKDIVDSAMERRDGKYKTLIETNYAKIKDYPVRFRE